MLIDMHCHSYLSRDCKLDPRAVLKRAEELGLDGVAFTETNTQDGCDELLDLAASSKKVRVFVGLELFTDKGQYLCFFPNPLKVPDPVQMWGSNRETPWSADEALPKLKGYGAAIVASRSYDRDVGYPAMDYIKTLTLLAAVEVFNPKVRAGANEAALEAARALRLPGVAGSDARTSLDELGYAATVFRKEFSTQVELIKALSDGQYWPAMMGELPALRRPGEARAEEAAVKKSKKRRWRH